LLAPGAARVDYLTMTLLVNGKDFPEYQAPGPLLIHCPEDDPDFVLYVCEKLGPERCGDLIMAAVDSYLDGGPISPGRFAAL
jgi:hypothetical protein